MFLLETKYACLWQNMRAIIDYGTHGNYIDVSMTLTNDIWRTNQNITILVTT